MDACTVRLTHVEGCHTTLWGGWVHGGHTGGHEVSDLLESEQTSWVFPFLHLILDQRLQFIAEGLKHRIRTIRHSSLYEIISLS